jgi:hypothetical protein
MLGTRQTARLAQAMRKPEAALLVLSNTSSEGVPAGHSAAPRRLQETGVSTR